MCDADIRNDIRNDKHTDIHADKHEEERTESHRDGAYHDHLRHHCSKPRSSVAASPRLTSLHCHPVPMTWEAISAVTSFPTSILKNSRVADKKNLRLIFARLTDCNRPSLGRITGHTTQRAIKASTVLYKPIALTRVIFLISGGFFSLFREIPLVFSIPLPFNHPVASVLPCF